MKWKVVSDQEELDREGERERAGEETELVRECEQKNRTQIQTAQQAHKIE